MGGLHVEVPYRMFDRNSGADFEQGRVHMMGHGALSFMAFPCHAGRDRSASATGRGWRTAWKRRPRIDASA